MPAMNISLQRRIGKLPKSPDYLDNVPPSIFEYNHRGFGTRVPTPTQKGFFGIGSVNKASLKGHGNEMGDGKMHVYGNDGIRSLPGPGIFGIGSAPGEETVLPPNMDYKPAHWETPGLFGMGEISDALVKHQTVAALLGLGMVMYMLK